VVGWAGGSHRSERVQRDLTRDFGHGERSERLAARIHPLYMLLRYQVKLSIWQSSRVNSVDVWTSVWEQRA
jgi:hypothetical protein